MAVWNGLFQICHKASLSFTHNMYRYMNYLNSIIHSCTQLNSTFNNWLFVLQSNRLSQLVSLLVIPAKNSILCNLENKLLSTEVWLDQPHYHKANLWAMNLDFQPSSSYSVNSCKLKIKVNKVQQTKMTICQGTWVTLMELYNMYCHIHHSSDKSYCHHLLLLVTIDNNFG